MQRARENSYSVELHKLGTETHLIHSACIVLCQAPIQHHLNRAFTHRPHPTGLTSLHREPAMIACVLDEGTAWHRKVLRLHRNLLVIADDMPISCPTIELREQCSIGLVISIVPNDPFLIGLRRHIHIVLHHQPHIVA
jgi:hypothetical protein